MTNNLLTLGNNMLKNILILLCLAILNINYVSAEINPNAEFVFKIKLTKKDISIKDAEKIISDFNKSTQDLSKQDHDHDHSNDDKAEAKIDEKSMFGELHPMHWLRQLLVKKQRGFVPAFLLSYFELLRSLE